MNLHLEELAEPEQDPLHLPDLVADDLDVPPLFRLGEVRVQELVGETADGDDRVAQLMGDEHGHLAHGRRALHVDEPALQPRGVDVVARDQAADAGQLDVPVLDGLLGDGVIQDDLSQHLLLGEERDAEELVGADGLQKAAVDQGLVPGVLDQDDLAAGSGQGGDQGVGLAQRIGDVS